MRRLPTGEQIRVATWNANRRGPSILDALADLGDRLDLVTLQEVTHEQADAFRDRLARMDLVHAIYTGVPKAPDKRYGNVIASRWPVKTIPIAERLRQSIPWPQLLGYAAIDAGKHQIQVITAHIPNGSGNGWAKIDTFRALADIMRAVNGRLRILTGDFNEPQSVLQDQRIVTFGQDPDSDGRYTCWPRWSFKGRTGSGEEWDAAVRWVFEGRSDHGLRNAFWDACGRCTIEETHRSQGSPRWFDHVFVSDDFEVRSCTYLHSVRRKGLSDHSALLTHMTVRDNDALHRTGARGAASGR